MELNEIIEKLKKEQTEIQQKDALLDAMFKNAVDAIVVVSDEGSLTSWNPSTEKLLRNSSLDNSNLFDFIQSIDGAANCQMSRLDQYKGQTVEMELLSGEETIPVMTSVSEISDSGEHRYSLIFTDMSEEKQHIQLLEEREQLLNSVIETAADGVVIIDDSGRIKTFNTACERIFGLKKEEVLGNKVNMLMPEEHAHNHDDHIQRYKDTGVKHIVGRGREVAGKRKDGSTFPMYLSVGESIVNGRQVFTGIIRDLTQQRDQEKMFVEETFKRAKAEEANFNMEQSVNYAKRIQRSILPSVESIYEKLDAFVFYKPKEVVSGDFYWLMEKGDHVFIAVVDCTGHGVPGAFMSMLGYTHLNYVTNSSRSNDPALILNHLDERVARSLNQRAGIEPSDSDDGMDISLVRLDRSQKEIVFAGAKRPLLVHRNGGTEVIKGSRRSIGGQLTRKVDFESTTVKLETGDSFFLYTDGLTDQFNEDGDKFQTKGLTSFIENHINRSMKEIGEKLELDVYRWRGSEAQMDDVTVMGVRL